MEATHCDGDAGSNCRCEVAPMPGEAPVLKLDLLRGVPEIKQSLFLQCLQAFPSQDHNAHRVNSETRM